MEGTYEDNDKQVTKEAVIDEDGNYFIMAKEETSEVTLKITPESQYSTIKLGDQTSKGELTTTATLTGDITFCKLHCNIRSRRRKTIHYKNRKSSKYIRKNTNRKYRRKIQINN